MDPEDLRAGLAIRDSLPTRRHAEMLFDMVADLLGEEAWVESSNAGGVRKLYRREVPGSPWLLPWPLLIVERGGRTGPSPVMTAVPGVYEEPKPRPGRAPRLRDLGPGVVHLFDGRRSTVVCYGADGRWFETSHAGPDLLAGVLPALAAKAAPPVEIVAAFVAGLDHARPGPGRVLLPVPLPGGAEGVWNAGLHGIRAALFRERVPRAARWVVADGWTGDAVAWGATREAALEAWRAEVARVRPFPGNPEAPPDLPAESFLAQEGGPGNFGMWGVFRGPSSDVPPVEPSVENSPAVALPLGELPAAEPPLGGWVWTVGVTGFVHPAALRLEPGGFTLVGDRALEVLDLAKLDDQIAAADRRAPKMPTPPPDLPFPIPPNDGRLRGYKFADETTGAAIPPRASSWGPGDRFHPKAIDGDHFRWEVLRLRKKGG